MDWNSYGLEQLWIGTIIDWNHYGLEQLWIGTGTLV